MCSARGFSFRLVGSEMRAETVLVCVVLILFRLNQQPIYEYICRKYPEALEDTERPLEQHLVGGKYI